MRIFFLFLSLCASVSLEACFCKGKSDQVLERCVNICESKADQAPLVTRGKEQKNSEAKEEGPPVDSLPYQYVQREFERGDYQKLYGEYRAVGSSGVLTCPRDSKDIADRVAQKMAQGTDAQNEPGKMYNMLIEAIKSLEENGIMVPEDYRQACNYFRFTLAGKK